MIKEFFTYDQTCKNDTCHYRRINPDSKDRVRFKCNSKDCFKIITLGTNQDIKLKKLELKT